MLDDLQKYNGISTKLGCVWGVGGIDDNGEGVKWMIVLHFLRIPVFTTKTFGFICVLVWMSVCGCWCRWRTFSL